MITLNKTFEIEGGTAPFIYKWVITGSCASVEESSGETDGVIQATFYFSDTTCFDTTTVTLDVTDSTGLCNTSISVPFSDPCSVSLTAFQGDGVYTFIAIGSGDYPPFTYSWSWDENIFTIDPDYANLAEHGTLRLLPLPGAEVQQTNIHATVTDSLGCSTTETITYNPCGPVGSEISAIGYCIQGIPDSLTIPSISLTKYISACEYNTTLDWDTFKINGLPDNVSYSVNSSGQLDFSINGNVIDGSYNLSCSIEDNYGNSSGSIKFTLEIPDCGSSDGESLQIPDRIYTILPDYNYAGSLLLYNISYVITGSSTIDWDTFTFQALSGQTVSSDGKTVTIGTDAEVSLTNNNFIQYKFLVGHNAIYSVAFTVETSSGVKSNVSTWTFDTLTALAPTVSDEALCVACEGASPFVDVLSSSTNVRRESITVDTQPSYGSIYITSGNLSYIPDQSVSAATDTFTYNAKSPDGASSNTGTVTVHRASAGIAPRSTLDITCLTKAFDLETYMSGQADPGTWSDYDGAYTAAGGIISNTVKGSVDFTGLPDGDYVFKKDVSLTGPSGGLNCPVTSTAYITVYHSTVASPSNDTCATATVINCPTSASDQYSVTGEDLAGHCPISEAPTLSSEPLPVTWTSSTPNDLWYKFTYQAGISNIYFTVVGDTLTEPQLAVYNDAACNCTLSELSSTTSSTGESSISLNVSGFNVGQCYLIRVSARDTNNLGTYTLYVSGSAVI